MSHTFSVSRSTMLSCTWLSYKYAHQVPRIQSLQSMLDAILMCTRFAFANYMVNNAAISKQDFRTRHTLMLGKHSCWMNVCSQPCHKTHTLCHSQKGFWKPLVLFKRDQTKLCHGCITSHCICRQAALTRQYLSCTYLAHHELESAYNY